MVYMLDKTQGKIVDKIHDDDDGICVRVRVRVVWNVRAYYMIYLQNQKHQKYDWLNDFITKIIIPQIMIL